LTISSEYSIIFLIEGRDDVCLENIPKQQIR